MIAREHIPHSASKSSSDKRARGRSNRTLNTWVPVGISPGAHGEILCEKRASIPGLQSERADPLPSGGAAALPAPAAEAVLRQRMQDVTNRLLVRHFATIPAAQVPERGMEGGEGRGLEMAYDVAAASLMWISDLMPV